MITATAGAALEGPDAEVAAPLLGTTAVPAFGLTVLEGAVVLLGFLLEAGVGVEVPAGGLDWLATVVEVGGGADFCFFAGVEAEAVAVFLLAALAWSEPFSFPLVTFLDFFFFLLSSSLSSMSESSSSSSSLSEGSDDSCYIQDRPNNMAS